VAETSIVTDEALEEMQTIKRPSLLRPVIQHFF
jgi:hypothetical protein